MGRLLLVIRLAAKDARRNRAEALLLLVAIAAATTTLTVALALHGVTSAPYAATRAATAGPDVVAAVQQSTLPSQLTDLEHAPGVVASSGPYLIAMPNLVVDGHSDPVMAEGRDLAAASVDQPKLTSGHWVRNGGVVIERSLANLLGLKVGDRVGLDNLAGGGFGPGGGPGPVGGPGGGPGSSAGPLRAVGPSFEVVGIAVTAALQPSPLNTSAHPSGFPEAGLVWVTRAAAKQLAAITGGAFGYTLNLKLADPSAARTFATAHQHGGVVLISWQAIAAKEGLIVSIEQTILLTGSWLLGLLALASVALLVGGRMEQQTRRVGLLKAVGATPALVTGVLVAEQLALALVAAAVGLVIGWLAAPLLTNPGASLVGAPGAPTLDLSTILIVFGAAIAVAIVATLVPAIRASRTSTVSALADATRQPRRAGWTIALSSRFPVPILLGMRLASRRRRRAVLSAASLAITVGSLVAVLMFREHANSLDTSGGLGGLFRFSGPGDPLWERGMDVMLVFTVALVLLALVNAVLVTWATVQDARHASAIERALGASPAQVRWALVVAQLLPALPGAILGVPVGVGLYDAVGRHGSTVPSALALLGVLIVTLVVVAVLTAIPARIGARRPVAEILQSETA
ncbi:MAG: FtsX-like permease family protein [Acidimicrobiales bacterium]|jgi:putative ABC transport system permease protein